MTVGDDDVALQVEAIEENVLQRVDLFYCCATCGKVFYEGRHFKQVRTQFQHVITDDDTGASGLGGLRGRFTDLRVAEDSTGQ